MLVIAHRGNLECGLENSWTAFLQAVAHKCDRIEFDVLFSKDNHPFVIHDENLLRLTGVDKNLDALTTQEVEKITLLNGEKIPRFEDVLDYFAPKISLNIELKSIRADHAHQVGALLCERRDPHLMIISSFYTEPLVALRGRYPALLRAVLCDNDIATPLGPQGLMKEVDTSIIHPEANWITDTFMDHARQQNWKVFPWIGKAEEAKNPTASWERLRALGVEGLCTNFPIAMRQWLEH